MVLYTYIVKTTCVHINVYIYICICRLINRQADRYVDRLIGVCHAEVGHTCVRMLNLHAKT